MPPAPPFEDMNLMLRKWDVRRVLAQCAQGLEQAPALHRPGVVSDTIEDGGMGLKIILSYIVGLKPTWAT